MTTTSLAMTIRAKKLGVLIRDARLKLGKSVEECSDIMGVSAEKFNAFEIGESSPTLPELEIFAYYTNIPLDHFWSGISLIEQDFSAPSLDLEQYVNLRQRMIGAQIRQAREQAEMSLDDFAQKIGLDASQLDAYELGQESVDLPTLEEMCAILERPLKDFMDESGPVGTWAKQQETIQDFLSLPPEVQEFVSKPVNRPYLALAQRLSEMSVDKLRAVGEGILEITL
jgi:transcriptional regulator with XRE-family HTH domain